MEFYGLSEEDARRFPEILRILGIMFLDIIPVPTNYIAFRCYIPKKKLQGGEEGMSEIEKLNEKSYKLVKSKCEEGAEL
ncbi:MAG: hypothetical protein KAT65_24585 [Methanophagales archaeon]|nr:hypothetical protein [Methanophagales archaeon]